jgi:hypothetical protein
LVKTEKTGVVTTTSAVRMDLPSKVINPEDIPINNNEILSKLSVDIRDLFYRFNLPESTEIEIQIESQNSFKRSLLKLKNPYFTVNMYFTPVTSYLGLPNIIRDYFKPNENHNYERMFATQSFILTFETTFNFPDRLNPLFKEHYMFAQTIQALIKERWDWNADMELLKDKRIKHINNNVLKILSLLEKKKEE